MVDSAPLFDDRLRGSQRRRRHDRQPRRQRDRRRCRHAHLQRHRSAHRHQHRPVHGRHQRHASAAARASHSVTITVSRRHAHAPPTRSPGRSRRAPTRAPVVDTATITPAAPTTDQTLTANVTSHDADGDPLTTSYQWTRAGIDIAGATGATLNLATAGNGDKGDLIAVRVTVNDGTADSAPVTSSRGHRRQQRAALHDRPARPAATPSATPSAATPTRPTPMPTPSPTAPPVCPRAPASTPPPASSAAAWRPAPPVPTTSP